MKLSHERLMEIAAMTRRRMLKLTGMAAISMAFPVDAPAAEPAKKLSREVEENMQRLRIDARFRGTAVMTPERVLPQLKLTPAEKRQFSVRLQLFKRVGMGLAFEAMRHQPGLRPLLLNPANVKRLIIMGGSEASRALNPAEKAQVRDISKTFDAICGSILDYDSLAGLENALLVEEIASDLRGGISRDDVDFVCTADQRCGNSGCTDSGCGDYSCTNGGCTNLGCDDNNCDNGDCSNELCQNHGTRCGDFDCSNGKKECLGGGAGLSEAFYENLAKVLESAIDRGPDMGFLVKAGGSTIRGETFLDERRVDQALKRNQPPASPANRPAVQQPNRRLKP